MPPGDRDPRRCHRHAICTCGDKRFACSAISSLLTIHVRRAVGANGAPHRTRPSLRQRIPCSRRGSCHPLPRRSQQNRSRQYRLRRADKNVHFRERVWAATAVASGVTCHMLTLPTMPPRAMAAAPPEAHAQVLVANCPAPPAAERPLPRHPLPRRSQHFRSRKYFLRRADKTCPRACY